MTSSWNTDIKDTLWERHASPRSTPPFRIRRRSGPLDVITSNQYEYKSSPLLWGSCCKGLQPLGQCTGIPSGEFAHSCELPHAGMVQDVVVDVRICGTCDPVLCCRQAKYGALHRYVCAWQWMYSRVRYWCCRYEVLARLYQ